MNDILGTDVSKETLDADSRVVRINALAAARRGPTSLAADAA